MNQQTLASEVQSKEIENSPSHQDGRYLSLVVSFSKNNSTDESKSPDVRFVCSNHSTLDVRMFIDESGEVHTTIREPTTMIVHPKKSIQPEIIPESNLPIVETVSGNVEFEENVVKKRGRGRPKGSKNKNQKNIRENHSVTREMFETIDEFKLRKAEELNLLAN